MPYRIMHKETGQFLISASGRRNPYFCKPIFIWSRGGHYWRKVSVLKDHIEELTKQKIPIQVLYYPENSVGFAIPIDIEQMQIQETA